MNTDSTQAGRGVAPKSTAAPAASTGSSSSRGPRRETARRIRLPWKPLFLAALLVMIGLGGPGDRMLVATTALIFGIAAIGLTVLAGPTRIVNLGASCFIGAGAFVTAYLNNVVGANFLVSLLVAMAACFTLGWAVAPIAARLAGIYIAIITVGLALLAQHVFRIAEPWTGGTAGVLLTDIPFFGINLAAPAQIGGVVVDRALVYFVLCSVILMIVVIAASRLLASRTGRALHVVGASSLTARSFGINPARYRGSALIFSAVLCGLAGGLLAGQQSYVAWEQFDLLMSIDLIAVVVLGGLGSVYGALAGAAILFTLPELVERLAPYLPLVSDGATGSGLSPEQFTSILYGVALIVVMVLEPRGLASLVTRVSDRTLHLATTTRKETIR